jgi:glycine cleavage system aminomethyltransferase T
MLQGVLSNDVSRLEEGDARYLLTNDGRIVDDLIAYRPERTATCSWSTPPTVPPTSTGCASANQRSNVRDVSDEYALPPSPDALDRIGIEYGPAFTGRWATSAGPR